MMHRWHRYLAAVLMFLWLYAMLKCVFSYFVAGIISLKNLLDNLVCHG